MCVWGGGGGGGLNIWLFSKNSLIINNFGSQGAGSGQEQDYITDVVQSQIGRSKRGRNIVIDI